MAPPTEDSKLILHETDEAENHTAVFIYSEPSDQSKQSLARVDISVRQSFSASSPKSSYSPADGEAEQALQAVDT